MKKRIPIKPPKSNKKSFYTLILCIFLGVLVIVGIAIIFWLFWDGIIKFIGTSGTLLLLVSSVVIVLAVSTLIVNKIIAHKDDKI